MVELAREQEEPASEHTQIQAIPQRRSLSVHALEYHLFQPRRAYDPLLDRAYEVWREGWRATFLELDGRPDLHSDDFERQDEIAVVAMAGECLAVTGLRWLDLSLPRAREDSYFKNWPDAARARVASRFVCVGSNTVIHPSWRGATIEPRDAAGEPARLAFATIALTTRRFMASPAENLIALTRNDRAIDRIATALGASRLAQIEMYGIDTDVICLDRANATPFGPIVSELWSRRHQMSPL